MNVGRIWSLIISAKIRPFWRIMWMSDTMYTQLYTVKMKITDQIEIIRVRDFLREGTQSYHAKCVKTDMISCFERHKLASTSRLFTWTRPDIEKLHCDGITTRHITAISVGATLPYKSEKVDIYIFVSARYTWRLLNNMMCDILSSPI